MRGLRLIGFIFVVYGSLALIFYGLDRIGPVKVQTGKLEQLSP